MSRKLFILILTTLVLFAAVVWIALPPGIEMHGALGSAERQAVERLVRNYQSQQRQPIMPDLSAKGLKAAAG